MTRQLAFRAGFHVTLTAGRLQVATMNLRPGGKEGGPDNIHRGAEQWVVVVAGTGRALLAGRRRVLRAGTLLRIPKGVPHEIRNTGRTLLKTVNIYTPPAYRADGEPLPSGKGNEDGKGKGMNKNKGKNTGSRRKTFKKP